MTTVRLQQTGDIDVTCNSSFPLSCLTKYSRLQKAHCANSNFPDKAVTATLLIIVETPLAIVSVCTPSIFHLVKRGFYDGMPGLFNTENPSKAIGGKFGEHVGVLGNPVDTEVAHVQRLIDPGLGVSQQRLVSNTTAIHPLENMSEEIPLKDINVRNIV